MTLVVAHRGSAAARPENTMEAFELAADQGADAVECDVHLLTDGALAVIHDDTLDRTTDATGRVAALSSDDLARIDAGARFPGPDGDYPYRGRGLRIPTFDQVLEWLPANIGLVVEIKAPEAVEPTLAMLRGHSVVQNERLALISFDEATIDRVRQLAPEMTTGYLLVPGQPIEPALKWALEHGHRGVHPWDGDLGLDPGPIIQQATIAYGRQMGSYVVNEPDRMVQLAVSGLWAFVTDVPDAARRALGPRRAA